MTSLLSPLRRERRTPRAALALLAFSVLSFPASRLLTAAEAPASSGTPPTTAPAPEESESDLVVLSPFEVEASTDNSYGALQSNSLTAFRVDLQRMPATAQVFTSTFIDDVAATSIEEMLVDYAGVVGYNPNNSGAALDMTGDRNGGQGLGIRGLQASGVKRDGFIGMKNSARTATGLTDNYDIERVELIEGPQSLLYGAVGGGGVINTVSKKANFAQKKGSVRLVLDDNGSRRGSFDYNYGMDRFAIRVAGVYGKGKTERYNLSNQHDFEGFYGQIAYRITPKITLRVLGEQNNNLAVFNNDTSFNSFLAADDPRRGENSRYLALTGQLDDITGVLDEGLRYENSASLFGWWSSERIDNTYFNGVLEAQLGGGFSAKLIGMYSETTDWRTNTTVSRTLLPASTSGNPFDEAAVRIRNAGYNEQLDRTRGAQFTLLHEGDFQIGSVRGRSQTAFGAEFSEQGPSFGSSGWDVHYYQADADWNTVYDPSVTQDYGRIRMPDQFFTVQSGIQREPLFEPGQPRVTIDGANYVAERRIHSDGALIDDQNLFGAIPNNPSNPDGFSGRFNPGGYTNNRLIYLANVTDWFDGKLTTVAGVSVNTFDTVNFGVNGSGTNQTILPERDYWGYTFGLNFEVPRVPTLRAYATVSTAGLSAGTTKDYYGEPLKVPNAKAPLPEVGLKWLSQDQRYSAAIAYNFTTKVENETRNAGGDFFNAVNPNGINGRFNNGDQWINLDREANSVGVVVTANPTANWRLRFSATRLDGKISSTVRYNQLYNDEFHLAGGTVTYADGTTLLVDPTGNEGERTTPLTLAMINDPGDPFWADPDPNSGRIRNSTLSSALTEFDPVHGTAATGATGLPIADIQYDFVNPHNGVITVVEDGDLNTGINEYSFNFQTNYSIVEGAFKGLSLFFDVRATVKNRAYYTSHFPAGGGTVFDATRSLVRLPDNVVFGLGLRYARKLPESLGNVRWVTQLNVKNLFDKSDVWILPNPANDAQLRARLSAQPRLFVWTNTFEF